jgi:hypothetical protein
MPELVRHPDFLAPELTVEAQAVRSGAVLELRYGVSGEIAALAVPSPVEPRRADELWRHTCLEAFVQSVGGEGYLELNLAPSRAWAAYHFDSYREGMRDAEVEPRIEVRRTADRLELTAAVTLPNEGSWRVGLTAVIEDANGARSYWALRHPPGKPDFHNADCFVLELP